MRIQNIVRELNGERIDVIEYDDDPKILVERALKNINITKVLDDKESTDRPGYRVIVPDDQYTIAIGRNGQNVRLVAKLTGFRISIISETDYHKQLEQDMQLYMDKLKKLPVVVEKELLNLLYDNGLSSVKEIVSFDVEDLAKELEVDTEIAERLISESKLALEEIENEEQA